MIALQMSKAEAEATASKKAEPFEDPDILFEKEEVAKKTQKKNAKTKKFIEDLLQDDGEQSSTAGSAETAAAASESSSASNQTEKQDENEKEENPSVSICYSFFSKKLY